MSATTINGVGPELNGRGVELPASFIEHVAVRVAELLEPNAGAIEPEPYLTVEHAAEYLDCKQKRIYDLCSQRRLPFSKDGSRTLLRREDLDAYLERSA